MIKNKGYRDLDTPPKSSFTYTAYCPRCASGLQFDANDMDLHWEDYQFRGGTITCPECGMFINYPASSFSNDLYFIREMKEWLERKKVYAQYQGINKKP